MIAQRSEAYRSRRELDVPDLERRVRRARGIAIALTLVSGAVLLPLGANYGATGGALVEPPPGWEPWLLGAAAVAILLGGMAAIFARRATYFYDRLPRPRANRKRGTDPR